MSSGLYRNLHRLVTDPDIAAERLGRQMQADARSGTLVNEVNTLTHAHT